jgi:hypothetical protein
MKTTAPLFGFLFSLITLAGFSQDRTTVTANSSEVSDNLDLRAVAHVFGESDDLEDFERRLNDPSLKISNLDLNGDNQVDYMRVIESVEGSTHLIIVQAVVGRDSFQDIATIEVEKDRRNRNVQVQIVGNVFLYGSNYIYEPVYYTSPIIYRHFWGPNYVAYFSPWAWSFYPTYLYAWNPWPVYTYHNHVNYYVNVNNSCYYTNHRRSSRAVAMHHSRRGNAYEKQHPNQSFSERNGNVTNRHELAQTRGNSSKEGRTASVSSTRDQNSRGTSQTRDTKSNKANDRSTLATDRNNVRTSAGQTSGSESIRTNDKSTVASSGTRDQNSVKSKSQSVNRSFTTTSNTDAPTRRSTTTRATETRSSANSSPQANRTSSKPSRSSDTSMNQSRSSKPTVSSGSPNRSNSSSAATSSQSSQRSSGGNSGNTNNRGGSRG